MAVDDVVAWLVGLVGLGGATKGGPTVPQPWPWVIIGAIAVVVAVTLFRRYR